MKEVTFVHINDGSSLQDLQLVLPKMDSEGAFHHGDCIRAEGILKKSEGNRQKVELHVEKWDFYSHNDVQKNPKLSPKFQDVRQMLQCRVTAPQVSAMLRVRSAATHAMHGFFQDEGFVQIHTPVITTNDCEGAGEAFSVELKNSAPAAPKNNPQASPPYFDVPAYLTVSAQLHLELVANALSRVYTFSPTFRGENSRTRHHLSEFYMVEGEMAFTQSLTDVLQVMENLIKRSTDSVMSSCERDIDFCWSKSELKDPKDHVEKLLNNNFVHMTYSEAISVLEGNSSNFKFKVKWGCDLQKEHEVYLVKHCGGIPVFLTDFPAAIKPFYMRINDDNETVAAVDLLCPEIGELCGGSLREERADIIQSKVTPDLQWYADMRHNGTFPHGGFGLGFDRYLMLLLGVSNIRDVVIFPRWTHNCKF